MEIRIVSENALIVYLGDGPGPDTLSAVRHFTLAVEQRFPLEVIDVIPGYHSVVVVYDPKRTSYSRLRNALQAIELTQFNYEENEKLIRLPVYYSLESGPDLTRIAELHGLDTEAIVDIHCSTDYLVYAVGFAPGFAYLGDVDKRIATPRLETPRLQVPRGAVAIADFQTAVYPASSPGGWNLIGLCPVPMFDIHGSPSMPCEVGDRVRFYPVSRDDYLEMGGDL